MRGAKGGKEGEGGVLRIAWIIRAVVEGGRRGRRGVRDGMVGREAVKVVEPWR